MIDGNIDIINWFGHKFLKEGYKVLDIGGGSAITQPFLQHNVSLTIIDKIPIINPAIEHINGFFPDVKPDNKFQCIWCSHVLEHAKNVNSFLSEMINCSSDDCVFSIIVPPPSFSLAGGHLNIFTPANLCYNVILAGQNLSRAILIRHKYNIALIWQRWDYPLPPLLMNKGDIEILSSLFPIRVCQGINGVDGWGRIRADDFAY